MNSAKRWYSRRDLPQEMRDLDTWPTIDVSHLPATLRDRITRRERALRAYLQGQALRHIRTECKIGRSEISRLLNRCVALHEDGRIYGWRALLPYLHVRPYVRLSAPRASAKGNAGTFDQFLRDHPEISEPLDAVILNTDLGDAIRESRYSHKETYGHFCRLCRKAGIGQTRYPLSTKDCGRRAIRRYARQLLNAHFAQAAGRTGGEVARMRARLGLGKGPQMRAHSPFDLVSIDAHRLNFIGCIGIPTATCVELVPIHRMQFLPLIDHYSTAVLGYQVSLTREPAAEEVIRATRHALTPWKPRALLLPGHAYPEGAMMPSAALPQAAGLCWNALLLDNATIHCSTEVAERLRKRLGCAINFGPVRQWYRRPLIESLFSAVERAGFLRLPNTTGTGPADPHRQDAATKAVKYEMLYEEMLDLIDIVVCTYNGTRREKLGYASPLERLSDAVLAAPKFWLPRTLPSLLPGLSDIGTTVVTKVLRGDRQQGRRPYIQYKGVRYTNPVLSSAYDLIGRPIRIHVNIDDLRTLKAFLVTGEEIGILTAATGWDRTPHDRLLREDVLRAIRDKTLVVAPGEDPLQAYLVLKAQQALDKHRRQQGQRRRVIPEATALARAVRVSAQSVPEVASGPIETPLPGVARARPVQRPWFVPQVKHRGVLK
jgi:putative transposase